MAFSCADSNYPKDLFISIVELPPMKCISFRDNGPTPERSVKAALTKFIENNREFDDPSKFRAFGFNNPMQGTPHGYELCLRIPDDCKTDPALQYRTLSGGLYAVVQFRGIENMMATIRPVADWVLKSEAYGLNYPDNFNMETDACPELEEVISAPNEPIVMNYYFPILRK